MTSYVSRLKYVYIFPENVCLFVNQHDLGCVTYLGESVGQYTARTTGSHDDEVILVQRTRHRPRLLTAVLL